MIKALFLDSHLTIEDTSAVRENDDAVFASMAQHLSQTGVPCSPADITRHAAALGIEFPNVPWPQYPFFWRSLLTGKGITSLSDATLAGIYEVYLASYLEFVRLYSDVLPFLAEVRAMNIDAYLVANGYDQRLRRFLDKFALNSLFSEIVISGETPFRKPDSFPFLFPCKHHGCEPSEIVMIGDRCDTDIGGARRLGMHTLLISRVASQARSPGPWCIPDFTIHSLADAPDAMRSLCSRPPRPPDIRLDSPPIVSSAFVLAGGLGSRLGPLGRDRQKAMLPIRGRPMLDHTVASLRNAGVERIVMAVGHKADHVKQYFGNGDGHGVRISYVPAAASTSESLDRAISRLGSSFYYCHGNVLFEEYLLEDLWLLFRKAGCSCLALVRDAARIRHQKVLEMRSHSIACVTHDRDAVAPFTFLGLGLYRKRDLLDAGRHPGMTEGFVQRLLDDGRSAGGVVYSGRWAHIETSGDYESVCDRTIWSLPDQASTQ